MRCIRDMWGTLEWILGGPLAAVVDRRSKRTAAQESERSLRKPNLWEITHTTLMYRNKRYLRLLEMDEIERATDLIIARSAVLPLWAFASGDLVIEALEEEFMKFEYQHGLR